MLATITTFLSAAWRRIVDTLRPIWRPNGE